MQRRLQDVILCETKAEGELARETEVLEAHPPQCHFVHNKSKMTWPRIESGQPRSKKNSSSFHKQYYSDRLLNYCWTSPAQLFLCSESHGTDDRISESGGSGSRQSSSRPIRYSVQPNRTENNLNANLLCNHYMMIYTSTPHTPSWRSA
jgi:hypothetical protein